jgi:hypothetical protein
MNQLVLFIAFFTVIASFFGLMQYRLYRLLRRWTAKVYSHPVRSTLLRSARWTLLLLNIFFVAQLFIRGTTFYDIPLIQVLLVYPMGLFFAMVVLAFLVTTVADVLRLLKWTGSRLARIVSGSGANPVALSEPLLDPGRRKFLRLGGLSAASLIGTLPIVASAATARDYQINKIPLSFKNLPAALEGFTIAQVSDIHSGIYMTENNMREIFEIVNPLNAQAIMVTGDFVDSSDSQIEPLYKAIEMLKAEYGIFGCLGNHDHFANAQKVSAAVEQRGITMLNNSHVSIDIDGEKLGVIGIDDAGRGQSDFSDWGKAFEGIEHDSFKIALTHRPDEWDRTRSHGIDLMLAGHTHGGQVGFKLGPLNLNPVYLVHKYPMGLFSRDNSHLYVNVGVGMVGLPIRLVKPEISLFTLTKS